MILNQLLLKHKPKDITDEKWNELWNNSGYIMQVLANVINEMVPKEKITGVDFDIPNHYAKMVWVQGQRDIAKKIIDLMPDSIDKPL